MDGKADVPSAFAGADADAGEVSEENDWGAEENTAADTVEMPEKTDEDELEAMAVAAQGEETFVSNAPMMPNADEAPLTSPADEGQVDSYSGDTGTSDVEETAEPVAKEPKKSLFQVMTAGLRSADSDVVEKVSSTPASNDAGQVQEQEAPSVGGVTDEDRPAPKPNTDQLEIPSFLRRQQN